MDTRSGACIETASGLGLFDGASSSSVLAPELAGRRKRRFRISLPGSSFSDLKARRQATIPATNKPRAGAQHKEARIMPGRCSGLDVQSEMKKLRRIARRVTFLNVP